MTHPADRPLRSVWTAAERYRMHARAAAGPDARRRPAVVLVHGLVVSSRYMVPAGRLLARDHLVLAPDLPGFGRSEKPRRALRIPELADTLGAWIDAVGLHRPVLVANSMGCQIAAELAARRPDQLRAMVLVGPTVDPDARAAPRQFWRLLQLLRLEPPSYWPILALDLLDAGLPRTWHTFWHMLDHRIEEVLPHVRLPALVVRGARDPITTQRWAEQAARLLPAGRLVVIPGAAHIAHYSAASALVRAIRPFLEACERPGRPSA